MLSMSQKRSGGAVRNRAAASPSLFGNFWRANIAVDRSVGEPATAETGTAGIADAADELVVVGEQDRYAELVSVEESGKLFRERLLAVLHEIAFGAMELGAREIYIGHPREYRYEFFVDDRGFQGAIKPSDYFGLLKLFGEEPELEIAVDWPDVEALNLSLTNNNLNPVIHVSWRYRWVAQYIEDQFSDQII